MEKSQNSAQIIKVKEQLGAIMKHQLNDPSQTKNKVHCHMLCIFYQPEKKV